MTRAKSLVLLSAAALLTSGLAACGNVVTTKADGAVALARSTDGTLTAVVDTCSGQVDKISIDLGREDLKPEETNKNAATLTASSPQGGTFEVSIAHPQAPWSSERAPELPANPDKMLLVAGYHRNADAETHQLTTTMGQLEKLAPGQVVVGQRGEVIERSALHDKACNKA